MIKSCVTPEGRFAYGIHKPRFQVNNLREKETILKLGEAGDGAPVLNTINFPEGSVEEDQADWIFEIPNAFPFRGTTYINRRWAESKAEDVSSIGLPLPPNVSLSKALKNMAGPNGSEGLTLNNLLQILPEPLLIALAATSTDTEDLVLLADISCDFIKDKTGMPAGVRFEQDERGRTRPQIKNLTLFEVLANNRFLPDEYKEAMVLRPGIQGGSEIVGEWLDGDGGHVFEYLRRNSYIPWGHYAANMANDCVRYRITDLSFQDMRGLRHLYYQRTYDRLAHDLKLETGWKRQQIDPQELDAVRQELISRLSNQSDLSATAFNRTLWGWNFGFDYAPSHYRLHASHQQIHQQYAMIPDRVDAWSAGCEDSQASGDFRPYACGDLVEECCRQYRQETGSEFFPDYIKAIRSNRRMDGRDKAPSNLVIYENRQILVFVPKAQTSQWELQLMTKECVGSILETDFSGRLAIDAGIFAAVRSLAGLGARMITSIEYSKRLDCFDLDQRLVMAFLPRLPESPGAFSEAQLRWINGHYPEDFAEACRNQLAAVDLPFLD